MTRPRTPHEPDHDDACRPLAGQTGPAQTIDPRALAGDESRPTDVRAMPSPGAPVPADEYTRLKTQAESAVVDTDAPAQEDDPPAPR